MNININFFLQASDTPMKPTRKDWVYHCTRCDGFLGVLGCKEAERCKHCGQKLDWKNVI